jgi:hypothetical protein
MSRASLIDAYVSALPFAPVAIVQTAGGCRVAVGGEIAPGETTIAKYYFKPIHIELLLGAAGLTDGAINKPPKVVAVLLEKTARRMHAPYETETEIRAAAKLQVAEITARVKASNQSGGLKQINRQYKLYRQQQIAKAEKALPYSKFLERYTATIVRDVAATGRPI